MKPYYVKLLTETSRTFLLPIMRTPEPLRSAVGAAYLCMRAIDEIEDHGELCAADKVRLLHGCAEILLQPDRGDRAAAFDALFHDRRDSLPEVTRAFDKLVELTPPEMRTHICRATAEMAVSMADWVQCGWLIRDEGDFDNYTFDVAGRVGLLLSQLWKWHEGIDCSDREAVGFGRALQAVNILRNRDVDLRRGVDYYPPGWTNAEVMQYARRQVAYADRYMEKLPRGAAYDFCILPLELAKATLAALEQGKPKLSRLEVMKVVAACGA